MVEVVCNGNNTSHIGLQRRRRECNERATLRKENWRKGRKGNKSARAPFGEQVKVEETDALHCTPPLEA